MKIVQIGPYPISETIVKGGVEASVSGISRALAVRHDVYVLDFPRIGMTDSQEKRHGISIYRFRNPGRHVIDSAKRISDMMDIIRSIKPDICHIHGTSRFCRRLFQELKKAGFAVVLTVHGLVSVEKKNRLRSRITLKSIGQFIVQSYAERRLLNSASNLIADTHYVVDKIKDNCSPEHISIIPQGVDDSFFHCSCSDSSNVILSVGAFCERKGHLKLIQAFEKVLEKGVDARLIVCGTVSETDYYQNLVNCLSGSPYRDRIQLRCDIPQDELHELYCKSHLFALYSQEESQGIVLAEAMAAGLPIVSTRVGGVPYVVKDGETGLLSDYGDTVSFARNLEILIEDSGMWNRMSERCRMESVNYSWDIIAGEVEQAYLNCR